MKRVEGYQCDNCGQIHPTEQAAAACEDNHRDRLKDVKITGRFPNKDSLYGMERQRAGMYPSEVVIRFSDHYGDFATYTLGRIGPRGL